MAEPEGKFCSFPNCNATLLVNANKEDINNLKMDLKEDFHSLHTNQKDILSAIQSQGAIQTEIVNIAKNVDVVLVENAEIFNRLRTVESTVSVNSNRLATLETNAAKGTDWVWDIVKLLLVAAVVAVATHLMMGHK